MPSGAAVWALGFLISLRPPIIHIVNSEKTCFTMQNLISGALTHLRGVSNTIIGICSYLKVHSNDNEMVETLNYLTGILTGRLF